jgi:hypothetical protein
MAKCNADDIGNVVLLLLRVSPTVLVKKLLLPLLLPIMVVVDD